VFILWCHVYFGLAYDVLSDPEKRRNYDQFGESGPSQGSPFDFDTFFGRGGDEGGHTFFNFDDLFKDDFFSFGGDFGHPGPEGKLIVNLEYNLYRFYLVKFQTMMVIFSPSLLIWVDLVVLLKDFMKDLMQVSLMNLLTLQVIQVLRMIPNVKVFLYVRN